MEKGPWNATIGGRRLKTLCKDPGFQRIVALMRLVNQIRFVNQAALDSEHSDSPSDHRQLNQSYFFTCALIFEGWPLAQRLAQHYRDRKSWKEGFGKLLRDREAQAFVSDSLKGLRNSAIFHPDEEEVARCLAEVSSDSVVAMSGIKRPAGATYYDLGDMVTFQTLVGPSKSQEEFLANLQSAMSISMGLLRRFLRCADLLIAEVLEEAKARIHSVPLSASSRPARRGSMAAARPPNGGR
jgi:hypothetical protein